MNRCDKRNKNRDTNKEKRKDESWKRTVMGSCGVDASERVAGRVKGNF